jgi:hypothetical protein
MEAYKRDFADEPFRATAVEVERWATLRELDPAFDSDEIVTCKNDLEIELPETGELAIVDFKTQALHGTALPTWSDSGAWRIDYQAMHNLTITRAHLKRIGERRPVQSFMIVRATRKPPFKFDRHVLEIARGVYRSMPRMIRDVVLAESDLLDRLRAGGKVKPNGAITGACFHRYGACDYQEVCTLPTTEDKRDHLLGNFVRLSTRVKL